MNLRLALLQLAADQGLDPSGTRRLQQLAGLADEPAGLRFWLPRALGVLAAALAGFGLVMWIAAHWDTLGRMGQFGLLQGVVALSAAGAWWYPTARVPLALLALLATGSLFAYFGQTYQTGADPWQLFALWALAGLPLALAARSDVVWTPWAVIALVAVSLWTMTHVGGRLWHRADGGATAIHLAGWALSLAVVMGASPAARRFTGAGPWTLRTAIVLTLAGITTSATVALFVMDVGPLYGLGLLAVALAAWGLARRATYDVFGLSAAVLAFDTLLVSGLARWLLEGGDTGGIFLLLSVVAAGLLALSVRGVLQVHRLNGGDL